MGKKIITRNVGKGERLAFYFAAALRDMSYALVGGFLTLFYIDVMGFAGTAALIIIPIITRIWDGVNDPLLGAYFDRRPFKLEKARPIFKKTALPACVLLVCMFWAPRFSPDTGVDFVLKCVFAVITYGLFEALHTLNGTAFMSLYNSISKDPDERTEIISVSRLFSMAGTGIVFGGIPVLLSRFSNDDVTAKTWVYLGCACLVALFFLGYNFLMYRYVKERVVIPPPEKQQLLPMFRRFAQNKLLILMILSNIIGNLINTGTIYIYFYTYNMGNPALQTVAYAVSIPAFIAGSLLVPKLVRRVNKRTIMIVCCLLMVLVNAVYLFAGYKPSLWVVIAALFLNNLPFSIKGTLYWDMVADSVDYAEWKTGFRNDGMVYSIEGCAGKIIGAVGAMFTGVVISAIHFVPNALVQSDTTMKGLFYIPVAVAVITTLLSAIPYFFYDLDRKKHEKILSDLDSRRQLQPHLVDIEADSQ